MEEIEVLEIDEKPRKRKLKKSVKFVLVFLFLFIIASPILTYKYLLTSVSDDSQSISFEVKNGIGVYDVGYELKSKGLIRNYYAYKIYVKLNNINEFKAGTYTFKKNYDTKEIVDVLSSGNYTKDGIKITFNEGKNIRDIARIIEKNSSIKQEDFYSTINDEIYIDSLIDKYWFLTDEIKNKDIYYSLEGYLFADTYIFSSNVDSREIIETMLNQSDKVFSKYKEYFEGSKYSVHEIITLASIIESEGIYEDDRKNIAGVFYNRLNSNMSLGSDITTYYAFKVDLGERDLKKTEIETYNPYNTRGPRMEGKLPIGAVSNFSESSLLAALNPTLNDYYYFVADKKGKTHFTKTYAEHEKIIKKLKQEGNWIEW